jgi:hypothetical protein
MERIYIKLNFGGSVLFVNENYVIFDETRDYLKSLSVFRDKTKYMVMSRDQNAGRNHSIKTDNSSIERVDEFKYLGTTLTNQNSIQEEIKSSLKLGNACCHSVQNLLSCEQNFTVLEHCDLAK